MSAALGRPVHILDAPHHRGPAAGSVSPLVVSRAAQRRGNWLTMQMFDSDFLLLHSVALLMGETIYVTTLTKPGNERKSPSRCWQKLVPAEMDKRELGPLLDDFIKNS